MKLTLPASIRDEIIAHSREDLPNECCGLIGGENGSASSIHRARNAFEDPLRYEIHPTDQLKAMNAIEAADEELVAIYHSHVRSEAYPSQTDINLGRHWPDPVYLICSLVDPDEPVVRGFELGAGPVLEVELAVD